MTLTARGDRMVRTGADSGSGAIDGGDDIGADKADRDDAGQDTAGQDTAVFTELFEAHVEAVWNHAYRLSGSWSTAEDIAARTFEVAWNKRRQVDLWDRDARPWLYTVAANLVREDSRSRRRFGRALLRLGRPDEHPDHAESVTDAVDAGHQVRRLPLALGMLPDAQRRAVELCLIGECAIEEAATALGVTESSIRSNLSRGRARLRALLKENQR